MVALSRAFIRISFEVLVSNAWGRSAYNVVRSLARNGLHVLVGTDKFRGMAAVSRYPTATFRHPVVTIEPDRFIYRIKEIVEQFAPAVYLPAGEHAYVVAKHRDALEANGTVIPIAPYQAIRTLHNKDELNALARSLGIPTPATIRPRDIGDVRRFAAEHTDPVVVKRISSTGARGVFTRPPTTSPGSG